MANKEFKILTSVFVILDIVSTVVCLFFSAISALVCFSVCSLLTVIFVIFTKKRYKKIEQLNEELSLICAGNYDIKVSSNEEGELSILDNNLFKVINILKVQNEELKNDKLYLSQSLADISHQLKTPLTSVIVMSDILKNEDNIKDNEEEFYSIIDTQLDKMQWLITNLLKLSKLDAGTIELIKSNNSVSDLIDECINPFFAMLDSKNIEITKYIEDFDIICDKQWTVEAIQNIIKNCIEHTQNNGKITLTSKDENIFSIITVSDNGCGISKEDLPHIFERFYCCNSQNKDSVGIGLAFAKTVFEKQKATLEVQSEVGIGTTFIIKFYKSIV